MSETSQTWTSGLIPQIASENVNEIISRLADLGLVISAQGDVLGVLANPMFRPKDIVARFEGMRVQDTLTIESCTKFESRLAVFLEGDSHTRPVEVNHTLDGTKDTLPIRYSFHQIGESGKILMLGRDLRPIADMQQQLVAAQLTLERDYEARREHDMQFRVLMASIDDAMMFVSLPAGIVTDCNPAARVLLGKQGGDLVGVSLDQVFEGKGKGDLVERLVALSNDSAKPNATLRTRTPGRMVTVRPVLFRRGGDQAMLCRIAASAPEALKSDSLQDNLTGLYERGSDAIVFVSAAGIVLSANEGFLNLADVTHGLALKGRSIVDFLARGTVDLNVMLDNAARSGTMRSYATRVTGEFGAERAVEIATTHVQTGSEPVFALVLRDMSRKEPERAETQQLGEVDIQSVIELIGSQSLRDIVAKTTDVVEKMCIETAVELTSNNRVAAAEMLGLSRQSLYVKLRKYGLLKSGSGD
ncbi:transcriptional regulator PpsR [uncultured Sulfitobacter sp.]|uniref:transcriptional regulator PpsR n=1 Tax=uncultured Sulfitobacter sp. TaxID=191468 RepID=UPI00261DCAFF|nr:transcriptional regulator PpsR [uncultured Sulfitobacter sp.]